MRRFLITVFVVSFVVVARNAPTPVAADTTFTVVGLPQVARGVNDNGLVIGYGDGRSFICAGQLTGGNYSCPTTDMGTFSPTTINDQDPPLLGGGGAICTFDSADGSCPQTSVGGWGVVTVNNDNRMLVYSPATQGSTSHAAICTLPNSGCDSLDADTLPHDLNDAGQIVGRGNVIGYGFVCTYDSSAHACPLVGLGTLPGGSSTEAFAINNASPPMIAGTGTVSGGYDHAFSCTYDGATSSGSCPLTDLGTCPGTNQSEGRDINNAGIVVGDCLPSGGSATDERAMMDVNGHMIDLNTLIPEGSGWALYQAYAINDNGWIVGNGLGPNGEQGFLLIPSSLNALESIDPAAATTTLRSSSNPAGTFQTVTYTATVTATQGGNAADAGTVTFQDDGSTICANVTVVTGTASCAVSGGYVRLDPHTITATYSGDAAFAYSTANALTQTVVNPTQTTTSLGVSPLPSSPGQQVTITATINPAPDGGTVEFKDGGTDISGCSAQAVDATTGSAACQVTYDSTQLGTHTLTAVYSGYSSSARDAVYASSTSQAAHSHVLADTTTTLSSSANPSPINQQVTYTATISPGAMDSSAGGGSIEFYDFDTGNDLDGCTYAPISAGVATCSVTYSSPGEHHIQAYFSGDDGHNPSSDTSLVEEIQGTATRTTPQITWSDPADITYGTALSGTQLNATATDNGNTVQGTFTYSPAAGTVLAAGSHQELDVSFTPTDSTSYTGATAMAHINVLPRPLTVTASSPTMTYGDRTYGDSTIPSVGCTPTGFVASDGFVTVPTSSVLNNGTPITVDSTTPSGTYTTHCSGGDAGANYSISYVDGTFTITQQVQTITFTSAAPTDALVGGATYTPQATGGASGNSVTFSIDSSAISVCSISGGIVSFTAIGTCVIDANQDGDTNYQAAPQVQQSFPVRETQSITFTSTPPVNAVAGGPTYTVTATGGASANPVTFSIDRGSASVCSISGATVSFTAAGSCVIDANQTGGAGYADAPQVQQTVTVFLAQAITFTSTAPSSAVFGGATYTPAATGGGSGNAVSLTIDSSATSVCSISSGVVSFTGAGTCTIDANQAGDATYAPAPQAQQSFTVGQAGQTITFTSRPPGTPSYGGTYTVTVIGGGSGNPVVLSVPTSAASWCSVSGLTVHFIGVGICTVNANQDGNANYLPAPQVHQIFAIYKARQTITFTTRPPAPAVYGGSYTVQATGGGSGNPVVLSIPTANDTACSVSGLTVSFIGAGICTINATQAGNANYYPAYAHQALTINKARQTITFTTRPPAPAVYGGSYTVQATGGGSGNPVVFSVAVGGGTSCSLSSSTVRFLGAGPCEVKATQAGNHDYLAANPVYQIITVQKATTAIQLQSSRNPAPHGQSVTFTATVTSVSPTAANPTSGLVTFKDGTTVLGSVGVNSSGVATLSTSTLATGQHSIVATYNGNNQYKPVTSQTLQQSIS